MRWPKQDRFPAMKTQCLELMQVANIRNNYPWNLSTESRDNFKTGQHIRVTGPLWGETSVTGGFPSWRVSDAELGTLEKLLLKQSSCQWLTRTDSSIGNGERHWAAWIVFHYSDVIMGAIASQISSLNYDCLLNRLFKRRSRKTSKLRATGLCAGNSQVTGEFPAQMASNAENFSIWWRHHALKFFLVIS